MPNRRRIKYRLVPNSDSWPVAERALIVSGPHGSAGGIASTFLRRVEREAYVDDPVPAVVRPVTTRTACESRFGFLPQLVFQRRMAAAYHCTWPHLP